MSLESIKLKISGITDGGLNTAYEMREVLTDMTNTLSGGTSSSTLDEVTTQGNTTTNTINVSGLTTEYIQMDIAPSGTTPTTGLLQWNPIDDTLDIYADGVTYQVGQEISPLVSNKSGSPITNGTPVMFVGTQGNTGRILIAPAIADGSIISSYILGIMTEDIANNEDGHATWFGKIRDLNTTGSLYGETWNDGDLLYVSPFTAGWLTNIKPEAPNLQIFMGVVINAHVNSGDIFTRTSWRGKITDLDDVNGTALTTDGQLLVWDNARQVHDFTHNINDYALLSGVTTIQTVKITLTSGDTKNIGTTPIVAVPAQGVGTVINAISAFAVLTWNSVAFDSNPLIISSATSGLDQFTVNSFLDSVATNHKKMVAQSIDNNIEVNTALEISGVDSVASGDSVVDIYVTYNIVTL
jgi:hypothetical protein